MSFANKFLGTGEQNISDGSLKIYGSIIGAKNLVNTSSNTVKIDASGNLYADNLGPDDIDGVISNPLTENLDADNFNINNVNNLEIDNGTNSITLNYTTGISDNVFDLQNLIDIDSATQNINSSTTLNQTDFDGDMTITGDVQFGGSLIGNLVINDVDITTQTSNLNVSEQDSNFSSAMANLATGVIEVQSNGEDLATEFTLSSIDLKIPTKGQKATSGSIPTVLSADYASTTLVQTSGGNFVLCALDGTLVSGNIPTNIRQIASTDIDIGDGITDTGTQRVVLSNDYTSTTKNNLAQVNGNTVNIGDGISDTGTQRIVLSNDYTSTAKNNLTQVNGNTVNIGYGISDTGSQRVVLSNDYTSTAYVATDGGNYVLCALDSSLVSGNIPTNTIQIGSTNIDRNTGAASNGSQRVLLTNDFLSTTIQKPLTSTLLYEKKIITTNLATNVGATSTTTFVGWSGSGGNIYLTYLSVFLSINGVLKMGGWGTSATPLNNGFWVSWRKNTSDGYKPIIGDSTDLIMSNGELVREGTSSEIYEHAQSTVKAIVDLSDNPLLIENNGGTEGSIRIIRNVDDYTSNSVTTLYIIAGYYYS